MAYSSDLENRFETIGANPFDVLSKADQKFLQLPENESFAIGLLDNMQTTKKLPKGSATRPIKPENLGNTNEDMFNAEIYNQKGVLTTAKQFQERNKSFDMNFLQPTQSVRQDMQIPDLSNIPLMSSIFPESLQANTFQPTGLLGSLSTKGMDQINKGQVFNPTLGKAKA